MLLLGVAIVIPIFALADYGIISEELLNILIETCLFFIFPLVWLRVKMTQHNIAFSSLLRQPATWNWRLIVTATAIGMIFSAAISVVQFYVASYIAPDFITDMLNEPTIDQTSVATTIFSLISACVFAPIMEELIFRGFFLHRMTHKWGLKRAVIVSFNSICKSMIMLN
jgi:membrane protease YdiL (CAAX protease family)